MRNLGKVVVLSSTPTSRPTKIPTGTPTVEPSESPTYTPTFSPSISNQTIAPSSSPSESRTTSFICPYFKPSQMESAEYVVRYNYDLHVEAGIGDVVDTISLLRDVQDQILLAVAVELLNGCQEPLRRLENENSSNATSTVANFLEVSLKPLDIMLSPSVNCKYFLGRECYAMEGYLTTRYETPGTMARDNYVEKRANDILRKKFEAGAFESESIFAITFNGIAKEEKIFAPLLQPNYTTEEGTLGVGVTILLVAAGVVVLGAMFFIVIKNTDRRRQRSNSEGMRKDGRQRSHRDRSHNRSYLDRQQENPFRALLDFFQPSNREDYSDGSNDSGYSY